MGGVTLITRDELGALFRRAHRDDAARLDAPVGGGEAAEQVARQRARALLLRKLEEAGARPGTSSGSVILPGSPSRRSRSSDSRRPSLVWRFRVRRPDRDPPRPSQLGTTGKPLVIPYTERDLATRPNGRASLSGLQAPDDTVLHCLAYGFYTGGVSDHLALEATGATTACRAGPERRRRAPAMRPGPRSSRRSPTRSIWPRWPRSGTSTREPASRSSSSPASPAGRSSTRRRLEDLWGAPSAH